jgi:hypothetical protein
MAGRNPQTQAKRARELAVKEKRERKRAKKVERASAAAEEAAARDGDDALPTADQAPARPDDE